MPEVRFDIQPGVFKDETPSVAEGYAIDTQGYRIHRRGWQTQGGYERATSQTFTGLVRGAAAWADEASIKTVGFGTADALYNLYGGAINNITPLKLRGSGTDIFSTLDGSSNITVGISNHGLKVGDTFTQSYADDVGGITLDASYEVTEVLGLDQFRIAHGSSATSTVDGGGGTVEYSVALDAGLVDGTGGAGFGTGPFGIGGFGIATIGDTNARQWKLSPMGQNLLAVPPRGALYEFQPRSSYPELIKNGDFASADDWTLDPGWSIGSGVLTATAGSASNAYQDLANIISGGVTYEMAFTVTVTAGTLQFKVTSEPGGVSTFFDVGQAIDKSGTYTRTFVCPPSPTDIIFAKDATFAGTIDDVSIKVASKAVRIPSAPQYSGGVMVDANNFAVVWATVRQDGIYDRLCVRWSDQGDNKTWLSSDDNFAGENSDFGPASEVLAVVDAGVQNLVFTNAGLFSMVFTGELGNAFDFPPIEGGAGLKAPGAVVSYDGRVFWWGADDNFYIYEGIRPQIIECPLLEDVTNNLAAGQESKITFSVRGKYGEVWISYPDKRDGNEVSRSVVFNRLENKWFNDTELRTQYIGSGVLDHILGFGKDGYLYFHDLGKTANGNALTCRMQTGIYDLGEGHNLLTLSRFRPDFKDQTGNIRITFYGSQTRRGPFKKVRGPKTVRPDTEHISVRLMARYVYLVIEAETTNLGHRHGAHRADINSTGARR